jgi:hypothetical protein
MGKSETDTGCPFGLMLGKPNREKYFDGLRQAKVSIEGKVHTFSLERANFWSTCPELRDSDVTGGDTPIRDLLERLDALTWKSGEPAHFKLLEKGNGEFELILPPLKLPGRV